MGFRPESHGQGVSQTPPQGPHSGENRCSHGQVEARRSQPTPHGSFLRQLTFYLKTRVKCPFCRITQPCSMLTCFPIAASYITVQLTGFTPAFQCPGRYAHCLWPYPLPRALPTSLQCPHCPRQPGGPTLLQAPASCLPVKGTVTKWPHPSHFNSEVCEPGIRKEENTTGCWESERGWRTGLMVPGQGRDRKRGQGPGELPSHPAPLRTHTYPHQGHSPQ